jgi:hypothetical protein
LKWSKIIPKDELKKAWNCLKKTLKRYMDVAGNIGPRECAMLESQGEPFPKNVI